jgi:hypothetical protein
MIAGTGGQAAPGGDPGDDAPIMPALRGGMGAMGGEGGMPGGGMMRPGMGMRVPGGGMPGGGMPGGGMMPRPGGMGMGMPGGGEGGYGGGMPTYTPPKYQLIRYTDKDVQPGRKYRYRFSVMVYDPNHPDPTAIPPSAASLHDEVRKRVQELDKEDAAKPKDRQTGLAYKTYWRFTPWSEASPVAEVPRGASVYAGKVTPRVLAKVKGVDVAAEPVASALAVVFDPSKKADVPGEAPSVGRGYVLNFSLDAKDKDRAPKVIHPVTKDIVELEKYNVTTNAMVADLIGGEPIKPVAAGAGSQTLSAIGEMLIVDADGKLHVQNEGDDILQYRRFTVPKPDPKAAKTAPSSDMPGGEGAMPVRGRLP